MNEALVAAVVAAFAAILAAVLTVGLTKRKEREAAWRSERLKYYDEFLDALSGTVGLNTGLEEKRRWARACNRLHLIASAQVVRAMREFQDVSRLPGEQISAAVHDAALTRLLLAIRDDLGCGGKGDDANFVARMWSAPPK